jgi:hypothetical protein
MKQSHRHFRIGQSELEHSVGTWRAASALTLAEAIKKPVAPVNLPPGSP